MEKDRSAKLSGAGMLLFNENSELLIIKSPYKNYWTIPGGGIESEESPLEAAIRETKEEVNIDCVNPEFLCIDYQNNPDKVESYQFLFHGGILNPEQIKAIKLQAEEISEYKFLPIVEAQKFLGKYLAKRIPKCLDAFNKKSALYLENAENPK